MGEIILNGRSYNNGTKYLEVTQAQYNALPANKLTDGTLYCITDAPGPGEGFPPMIYSYEEREVGVWVDGKPLYQKTVNIPAIAAGTNEYQLDFGITTVDKIIDIQSIIFSSNKCMILPYALRSNLEQWGVYQQGFDTSTGKLRIDTGDLRAVDFGYSTITYTKTTDVAGAGTWLPDGTESHHYSTDEHIIGTWIDGKTLYEKTIEFTATSTANTYTLFAHNISNVDVIMIDFSHSYLIYNEISYFQIMPYAPNVGDQEIRGFISKTSFDYRVGENTKGKPVKLTVQYTKTTD